MARTIRKAEAALELAVAVANMQDAAIRWPSVEERHNRSVCLQSKKPIMTKKIGFIDGKSYKAVQPTNSD